MIADTEMNIKETMMEILAWMCLIAMSQPESTIGLTQSEFNHRRFLTKSLGESPMTPLKRREKVKASS